MKLYPIILSSQPPPKNMLTDKIISTDKKKAQNYCLINYQKDKNKKAIYYIYINDHFLKFGAYFVKKKNNECRCDFDF